MKHTPLYLISLSLLVFGAGCSSKTTKTTSTTATTSSALTASDDVAGRTDYVVYSKDTTAAAVGGLTTHTYIVGRPTADASVIQKKGYFVPWRIQFSQVQRLANTVLSAYCQNTKEQVLYIDGYIDVDMTSAAYAIASMTSTSTFGPLQLTGTIHETVTGEAGTWTCNSDILTSSVNAGSTKSVADASGEHTGTFSSSSNLSNMTTSGGMLYLDVGAAANNISFLWPAGTKIEYAPTGTTIPLEPLAPNQL